MVTAFIFTQLMMIEFGLRLNKSDSDQLFNRVKKFRLQRLSQDDDLLDPEEKRIMEQELADKVSCSSFYAFLVSA